MKIVLKTMKVNNNSKTINISITHLLILFSATAALISIPFVFFLYLLFFSELVAPE